MKSLAVVLLVAATLCVERALSLSCYRCENVKFHQNCTQHRCSDMDQYCVSLYSESPGKDTFISKWCSAVCPTVYTEIKGAKTGFKSACCKTDYCNSGGPSSVKTSYALMATAALASFFCILRTGF
ncbi:lymphocyte antigen 6E [Anolis carolinensis]|uniref:lymphocyte antigen 6E n=1 Tax=Anolis carolinensis TaxID=28377 RepID=UPI002F2B3DE8